MRDKRNKNLLSAAQKIINGQTNGTEMAQTAQGTALGSGITTPKNLNATTDYAALADKYMRDYDNSKFSYDFNTDPVYQAAKQAYINQGKIAAKNVAAQAAKFTGGYGNSYGTMAAQQQYNAALQNANDIIPELQNAAYSRYQNDLAKKQNLANWYLQNSRYQKEDERYADELAYSRDRDRISDERYADELAYSRDRDKVSDTRYADELAYSRGRDKISDERYADETKYNREQAAKEWEYKLSQAAAKSSGSSGRGSGKSSSGSSSGKSSGASGISSTGSSVGGEAKEAPVKLSGNAQSIYKELASRYVPAKTATQRNTYMSNRISEYVEAGTITAEEGLDILDKLGVSYTVG